MTAQPSAGQTAEPDTPAAGAVLAAALSWHDVGASVVPASLDGSKKPRGAWKQYQQQRADRDQVAAWFADGHPGLGIITGAVSGGLELLELEGRAVDDGIGDRLRTLLDDYRLGELVDRLDRGYCEVTPSGGVHFLYRVEGGVDGNTTLARRPSAERADVLIETRGEGGFVIVAPSYGAVHPSGKPYELVSGGPATVPTLTAQERDDLHAVCTLLDEMPTPEPIPERTPVARSDGSVLPGDDFNERGRWEDILAPHDWTLVRRLGHRTFWRRPGKSIGISAVTGGDHGDYFYNYSTSTAVPAEQALSKWRLYAMLEHGGDFSGAASELARQGYGDQRPQRGTLPTVAMTEGGTEKTETGDPQPDEWEAPISLGEPEQPPFPIEHLGALRPIVDAVSEAHQVPADFAALHALGVVSAAIGGNRAVQILPDWTEDGGIYGVTAAASSERKSPPFALLTQPLREAEQQKTDDGAAERAEAAEHYDVMKSRYEEAKREAGKVKNDRHAPENKPPTPKNDEQQGENEDNLSHYRRRLDELGEPPAAPRLLASDITPEAIARIMHEQGGRLAILATEGGIFDTLAGRYSGTPNFDVLLNGYSGEPVTVDRQGAEPIRIPAAHLVMLLCVQPHVLESIGRKQEVGFRGRGLLGRFLYSLPASMVGRRSLDPTPVPDNVRNAWSALVSELVDHVWSGDRRVLPLDPDAAATLRAYRAEHEPRLAEDGGLDDLPDWAGKLPGHLVRVALALTLANNPQASAVTGAAMRDAVAMSPYFEAHARHAYQLMTGGRDERLRPARAVLAWIRRHERTTFSTREAQRGVQNQAWATETAAVEDALDELAEHGWIAQQETATKQPRRGRPKSPQWDVSPHAHRRGQGQKRQKHPTGVGESASVTSVLAREGSTETEDTESVTSVPTHGRRGAA